MDSITNEIIQAESVDYIDYTKDDSTDDTQTDNIASPDDGDKNEFDLQTTIDEILDGPEELLSLYT